MLQRIADVLTYDVMAFPAGSRMGESVSFFLYDSAKILLLLLAISWLMGLVHLWFPVEKVRAFLSARRLYGAQYLLAALFGAVTPFCSCSSIPLFIGFVRGGIPPGVTLAFLITSPLVNEVAVALFLGSFGWQVTLVYVGSGLLLGTLGGALLGQMRLERYLSAWVAGAATGAVLPDSRRVALAAVTQEAWGVVRSVLPYVLAGIAIGALLHGWVPEAFFADLLSTETWWSVPAAVVCAVPLYANAAGIVPVMQVLVAKGVPLGTALAFMMATVGLSLPEALLLRKVMQTKLLSLYFGTVTLLIMLSGYLFNALLVP